MNDTTTDNLCINDLINDDDFLLHMEEQLKGAKDFSNVCRICASVVECIYPIFEEDGFLSNNLAGKINKYLPIKVIKEDGLPQVVCYQCQNMVLEWDKLVKCTIQAKMVLEHKLSLMQQILDPDKQEMSTDNGEILQTGNGCPKCENENKIINVSQEQGHQFLIPKTENIQTAASKDGKKYIVCNICTKSISLISWKRHSRSHQVVKHYRCHVCGLGFNDSGNLARHNKALHAAYRPHVCQICNKSFSRNNHLQDHVKCHSENRDYVCDVCGRASKSSAALRMHRKIHEADYKFRCAYCESKFKRRGQLVAHISVHTGEKGHICDCGKAFRLKSQLTSHRRVHDKVKNTGED